MFLGRLIQRGDVKLKLLKSYTIKKRGYLYGEVYVYIYMTGGRMATKKQTNSSGIELESVVNAKASKKKCAEIYKSCPSFSFICITVITVY